MRRINFPFAALLVVATALCAGGFHLLHAVQKDRIAKTLLWQMEKCRDDNQTDQAIKFASQYLDFRPTDVKVMTDLAGWLQGRARAEAKQLYGVAHLYEKILRVAPDDTETRFKAAQWYAYPLYRYAEALDHLTILRETRPNDAKLFTLMGYCQTAVGKHAAAADCYKSAIAADPNETGAYVNYASLLQTHLNRPDREVEEVLNAALKANPKSASAHAARAQFLRRKNRFDDAAREIDLAMTGDKADWSVTLAAAEIAQAKGDLKKARDLLDEGAKQYPTRIRYFACSLAWLQLHEGRGEKAVETLREAQKVSPKDTDILTLLGDILATEGQVEPLKEALKELTAQKAAAKEPTAQKALADRVQYVEARLAMRRGRFAEAAATLDKLRPSAMRSPSLYRQTNHLLAQCYEQLGETNGELEAFRRMLENDPNATTIGLEYARALGRAGKTDEALREFVAALRPTASSRAVAETARFFCDLFAHDARALSDLERSVDTLKLDDVNPNTTLAKAEVNRARRKTTGTLEQVVRVLNKQPTVIALHAARVRLVEQIYGVERALLALDDGERFVGDAAEFRVLRARLTARRGDKAATSRLFALAQNLDRFSADDRLRVLSELAAASRLLDDKAGAAQYLTRLVQARPDYLPAREALAFAALKAGDELRYKSLLAEIESVEGKDGASRAVVEATAALMKAHDDATQLGQANTKLDLAAKLRPRDAIVEFLRGRADEISGRADMARTRYQAACRLGLLDKTPVEDVFACVAGPVTVLREELTTSLKPERHPTAVMAALPIFDTAGREALAARFAGAVPANDAVATTALGRLFVRLGFDRQAEELYRRGAKLAPQSNDSWLAMVTEHARRNDAPALAKAIAEVRAALPTIDAHAAVGRGFESAGRYAEARQEYRQMLVLKPDDARGLRLLANLDLTINRSADAQKSLLQLATLRDEPATAEDVRWARRNLATLYAATPSLASFHKALNLLDATTNPSDDDLRARVIVLSAQKSRPYAEKRTCRQEAIRVLETVQQKATIRSADDLVQLARLYRAENDEAKAKAARERLRRDFAGHYGSLTFLAREALRDFELAECEKLLPAIRQLGAGQFETTLIEFQCRTLSGEGERARRMLSDYIAAADTEAAKKQRSRRVAELVFDFTEAYPLNHRKSEATVLRAFGLQAFQDAGMPDAVSLPKIATLMARNDSVGPALQMLQRMKGKIPVEAVAAAQVAVLRSGQTVPQHIQATERYLLDELERNRKSIPLQLTLADFYDVAGAQDKAIATYRAVLNLEPENVIALNNLAWVLSSRSTTVGESLALIDRAVDLVGPADELLDTRARIRFESGRTDAGLRDQIEALVEAPSATRHSDLAKYYKRAGKPEQAEQALALARQFGAP